MMADHDQTRPLGPLPDPKPNKYKDKASLEENSSSLESTGSGSVGSLEPEIKKKTGFFKRLTSRNKKIKLRTVSAADDASSTEENKADSLVYSGRCQSQPNLLRDTINLQVSRNVHCSPKPANRAAVHEEESTPRRSHSVPKPVRLTPVVETPSEFVDVKRSFAEACPHFDATDQVFTSAIIRDDESDKFLAEGMVQTVKKSEYGRLSLGPSIAKLTSLPRRAPSAENVLTKREYRDCKPDLPLSVEVAEARGPQSELSEPRKGPAPLTRGPSSSRIHSWINSVTIFLFEGKDLPAMDRNGLSDPFCKFKLGTEKHRTRIAYKTLNPRWMEQFDLFIYDPEDKEIEITVWDWDRGLRNDYMGKAVVNVSNLEGEKLHDLWLDVENEGEHCGSIHLSVLVSGKKLTTEKITAESEVKKESLATNNSARYNLRNALTDVGDVGMVSVKVYKGCALRAADLNGKSDPYCVLQLVNARLQTQVEPKTLDPEWNRVFTFPVNDIHSVLDITVLDMDQDKSSDFLGRVAIPLMRIHNNERRWYALKDQKLLGRAKGSILLEMELVYNPVRAALRTLNAKEARFDDRETKFKRQVFVRNVNRIRSTFLPILDAGHFVSSCLNWESKQRSITAFVAYLLIVYYFEVWMMPGALLLLFLKYYIRQQIVQSAYAREPRDDEVAEYTEEETVAGADEDEDLDDDPNRAPKNTGATNIVAKVRVAQEQLRVVQNLMGNGADLCEQLQNTFQFVVPWLSYLAILMLAVVTVILYFIPVRVLLLLWGIHKFTKKLRKPTSQGNNEVMDFLSRVHTNEEVKMYRELRPKEISPAGGGNGVAPYRRDNSKAKLTG